MNTAAASRSSSPRQTARSSAEWLGACKAAAAEVPPSRYLVFFAIVVAGCATDLVTKSWMFGRLGMPDNRVWWIWEGVFGFQTSLNEGALFGFGQGMVPVFAVLSIVAAVGIVGWLFLAGGARSWLLTVALGCVTTGVFGNLYDRLGLHGLRWPAVAGAHRAGEPVYAVRDWILVMIGPWPWPNFNIADSLLVLGAAMLAWHALRSGPEEADRQPGRPTEAKDGPAAEHRGTARSGSESRRGASARAASR